MLKRSFDICFSLLILPLLLPLFAIVALGIKCTSKGPIFYSSLRFGRGNTVFPCWKFRTMHQGAEESLNALLENDPALRLEFLRFRKLKKDPRIFPFGNFLRTSSLDELPQFWNVLKGEMSVVGPRPYMLNDFNGQPQKRMKRILSCKPGITGLWQTSGRNLLSFEERFSLDELYVKKQSFARDLWLLAKTVIVVFTLKGAF